MLTQFLGRFFERRRRLHEHKVVASTRCWRSSRAGTSNAAGALANPLSVIYPFARHWTGFRMTSFKAFAFNKFLNCALVLVSALMAVPALAQDNAGTVESGLRDCGQITDSVARYACYDRLTSTLRPSAPGTLQGPTRSTIPAVRPTAPASDTPAVADTTAPSAPAADAAAGGESREMTDTVTEVRRMEPGLVMVTLASGQVWRQVNGRAYPLKAGMQIRLYKGLFGTSWRITNDELKGFIQVERVK
jgi:hypothetical protein